MSGAPANFGHAHFQLGVADVLFQSQLKIDVTKVCWGHKHLVTKIGCARRCLLVVHLANRGVGEDWPFQDGGTFILSESLVQLYIRD